MINGAVITIDIRYDCDLDKNTSACTPTFTFNRIDDPNDTVITQFAQRPPTPLFRLPASSVPRCCDSQTYVLRLLSSPPATTSAMAFTTSAAPLSFVLFTRCTVSSAKRRCMEPNYCSAK